MSDKQVVGLYRTIVTDIVDPAQLGRVEVRSTWLDQREDVRLWAALLSPYAGSNQGLLTIPDVGSEVFVGLEGGKAHQPIVVGACWSASQPMPIIPVPSNELRLLQSRAGARLEFDDAEDAPIVAITLAGHQIAIHGADQKVEISHASGAGILLTADGGVSIRSSSSVEVSAPVVEVQAAAVKVTGAISCTTLTAGTGIVSPSYS